MRLRSQLIISIIVFGIVLLVISASVLITNQQVASINNQEQMANDINTGASSLAYISNDYFLYQQSEQLASWQIQFSSLSTEISKLNSNSPDQAILISNVKEDLQRLNTVFNSSVSILESTPQNASASGFPAFQTASSRLNTQNQALAFDAALLSKSFSVQADQVKQTNNILIFALLGAFGMYFVLVYFIVFRRTFRSITKLQDGTKIIGSGNLDYAIDSKSNDEIGELSQAFNQMTANLKTVTASKTDLEKAQVSLRESEQRWATTLASIGDAVIATDQSGKIMFMNDDAEELTGWTLIEAMQKPVKTVFNIVNEQTRLEVENPIERVLREGIVVGLANHTVLIRKDGKEVPVDDSGAPIKDQEGKTTGVVLVFRDITERKQQERALENMAKFPSENPNPVFRVDRNGIILYGNQAGAFFLTAWNSKVGEHAPENISRAVAEALASNKRIEIEETYGAKIFLLLFGPVTLEDYVNIYALDITERKKGEEALRKLYRHQRAVSNSNQALMHATEENLLTQEICNIIVNDCGYSLVWVGFAEHDQNKTVRPVAFAGFDKGYIDSLRITWDENSERGRGPTGTVIRTGKLYICKNVQIDPNCEPWRPEALKRGYTASLVLPLTSIEGKTFGALNIYGQQTDPFTDEEVKLLTELANDFAYGIMMLRLRKEREQAEETVRKQASLIDLSPDAIIINQLDGTISFWSKGAEKLYGWTRNEAIGQDIHTLLKTEFPQPLREILNIVKREGKWSGEIVHTCKDGSKVVVQSFWLGRFGADGKIVEILESNVDITQRIELQVKLEESAVRVEEYANQMEELANKRAEQLKDAERLAAIGAIAGMVGHDIRNPLQAITGDIFLAKTDLIAIPDSEEKKCIQESLSEIEKNVDYINKIVADLQDFARPLKPNAEETDIKLIIDDLLKKNVLPENIKVTVKVDTDAKKVLADSTFINRIMHNLVNNAVQAMPKGGKLTIHTFKEANDVLITVKDTGVGIPEAIKGKLFTPMFTTKSKGQGFGLAVIKRMAESLGGTVSFESQEGKGTTFIIRLPPPQGAKR
jgi:PAS domain S-box-containing protein